MLGGGVGAQKGLRWGILVLAVVVAVMAVASDEAEARRRKKFRPVGYTPPYAAMVVDANSGQVLHAANADSIRHPASLTKIMTLYLLFEQIEAGKLKLDSELRVSAHAASQAPSKLGVRPGQTIEVEDAIKALVTKSANDVAVVIGEAIGGDEEDFAKLMTRKARSLGMSRTTYTNASGLPDPEQVTTARDQVTLGRAIQDRFPKLYRYFATSRFHYHGRVIGNHNRLLGRVYGVDGIKTGYVRASGFNLVSSMRRDDRHIVACVLGGTSGRARDARMRQLLEGNIVMASARRTAPKLIEVASATAEAPPKVRTAAVDPRLPQEPLLRAKPEPAGKPLAIQAAAPVPPPGSADPIRPILVKTLAVRRAALHTGAVASLAAGAAPERAAPAAAAPPPAAPGTLGTPPARQVAAAANVPVPAVASETRAPSRAVVRGEWIIQIGAFPAETQANDRLKEAQTVARTMLGRAEAFTERVVKGDTTLYRARFAGFDKDRAEAACKHLKRNEISCLALKN